ncbi:DUF5107 domain-containing protein [Subtercola boreus]|uniref:DUF5107 domain-containing protein n=1 Tax=Subtercola boreus TaxID=120213 RepID=A0A3E0WBY9_9MICO|nr:DUF5107 domain-containing protein [Subtercola boreus]RFA20595.1 hypothetical protein B7R24_09195 [Subtercola boreus]RFA20710.1 hypothetical protein B7R23_09130 [Subtercola boreus]RFA26920.1 hypothetical protein B7R25_09260 [Subtercola boreus]
MLTDEATDDSRIDLPAVPAELSEDGVACWSEPLVIDTYLPGEPDTLPAFLEQRVYQGSSGRVYPLPFHERISQTKAPHEWQAIHLENEWLRVVVLPELGGRIHIGYDKVAGYDFFYRNNVIKPALVGLAGPWISGGVEFNWPQHHRPATFLPTDVEIEREADGSVTVWCSDHDPFSRMKGMHGIRLRPGSSLIEARVRLYNRTPETQTFLWWANVAAAVDDTYQSFFPVDVDFVADHAKRAIATFPAVDGSYYGVDYPARRTPDRPDGDRLDWYRNIPVPTSYMVTNTADDFFGGYDHGRGAGFVHWADRHLAPGKKQWTWGNEAFGQAWDANLTDSDGPYVELMAGAYTDNQPDFSFLAPGETKTFSQYWYPIRSIGPVQQATREVAVRLDVLAEEGLAEEGVAAAGAERTRMRLGVVVTSPQRGLTLRVVNAAGEELVRHSVDLDPGSPFLSTFSVPGAHPGGSVVLSVERDGRELLRTRTRESGDGAIPPVSAAEPAQPGEIETLEELFLTGLYLHQYRHATRLPEPYWREALRRDPFDVRSNTALAARMLWAGSFAEAELLLRNAIARLTARVPNPAEGEAHFLLGRALVLQGRETEAREIFEKAAWNAAWRTPARFALAQLAARAGDLRAAEENARAALRFDPEHLQAAALLASVLLDGGREPEAAELLERTLSFDALDQWTRVLAAQPHTTDAPTLLDVALEFRDAGSPRRALETLAEAAEAARSTALGQVQVAPLVHYHRASLLSAQGDERAAAEARAAARRADRRFTLASRLADVSVLREAAEADAHDELAAALLGNWYYDKRRYDDAERWWQRAVRTEHPCGATDPAPRAATLTMVHRNLAIAAYNVSGDADSARACYSAALELSPDDAKLWFESDQLDKRLGVSDADRLAALEPRLELVLERDDLSVAFAELLTGAGRASEALDLLASRRFQPWEGGEGQTLTAWENATVALAEASLADGALERAARWAESSIHTPAGLGEARHFLANAARLYLLRGDIAEAAGRAGDADEAWSMAAAFTGDFQSMSTRAFSDQTVYSIVAFTRLGRSTEAEALTAGLRRHVDELASQPAVIDYFATSLPTMLLFTDDPQAARDREVALLRDQLRALLHPTPRRAKTPAGTHTEKGTP